MLFQTPSHMTVRGKTYKIRALTNSDYEELLRWGQDREFDTVTRQWDRLNSDQRDIAMKQAVDRANRLSLQDPQFYALLSTPEGFARVIWFGVRSCNEGVTENDVKDWMNDPKLMDYIRMQHDRVNGTEEQKKIAKAKKKSTKAGKKKKRVTKKRSSR